MVSRGAGGSRKDRNSGGVHHSQAFMASSPWPSPSPLAIPGQ